MSAGPQMGVIFGMECVHPGQNRSVRQKFYNQRNHNRRQNELRHFAQNWLFYVLLTSKEGNIAFLPHPLRAMLCPCSSLPIKNNKHRNFEWRGQGRGADSFVLRSYPS